MAAARKKATRVAAVTTEQASGPRLGRRGLVAATAAFVAGMAAKGAIEPERAAADNGTWTFPYTGTTSSVGTNLAAFSVVQNGSGRAIYAKNADTGNAVIWADNTGGGVAVRAEVSGSGGSSLGVYSVNGTAGGTGVRGDVNGADSTGVYGLAQGAATPDAGGAGVVGEGGGTNFGVKGVSQRGTGVYGTTAGAYGLLGQTGTGGTFDLYGSGLADGSVAIGGVGYNGGLAAQFSGPVTHYGPLTILQGSGGPGNAFIVGPGVTKNAAVLHPDGTHRLYHCVEAPEPWFEDFGEGTISGGRAEVRLDPGFAGAVDMKTMHVFLTETGSNNALHIARKSATGFAVEADAAAVAARGRRMGDINGTFSYRVVAKRRDVSGERLAKITLPVEIKQPAPLPKLEPFAPREPPKKEG